MESMQETGARAAIGRFAMALDAMLVNGATMCLTPLRSAKDFIETQLYERAAAELAHLRQRVVLTEEEQFAFADHLSTLKDALLALLAHQSMPKEPRDVRIRELTAVYVRARERVKQLEHRLGLPQSFYKFSDGPHGQRAAEFVVRLLELYEREQSDPVEGFGAVGCGAPSPRVTDEPLSRP